MPPLQTALYQVLPNTSTGMTGWLVVWMFTLELDESKSAGFKGIV